VTFRVEARRSSLAPDTSPQMDDAVRPLAAHEFEQIRELAHRAFGLDLRTGKEDLVSARLRRLVRAGGFRSFHQYYQHVLSDATGKALSALIDALATNHTSFNREPDHFDFLRRHLEEIFNGRDAIEIWSAACSTGEEIWTLAALLNDAFPRRDIRLAATDISRKALDTALRAVYPIERCASMPAAWLARYFSPEGCPTHSYRVLPRIRAQVSFRRVNLLEPVSWPRPFPVIFCRNAMIYFDQPTQERVIRNLVHNLAPGGYFFVGHAESLTRISHPLQYVRPAVYRSPGMESSWTRSS
jgi:chemotaxis protein methyltransferase CheR